MPAATASRGRGSSPARPGLEHRIGGIEKQPGTGNIDYSPGRSPGDDRHPRRQGARRRQFDPRPGRVPRPRGRRSWRWSAGARPSGRSTRPCAARSPAGKDVAHIHVRHIWPLPKNLGALLKGFEQILVPEMNMGQFKTLLRDQYLVDAQAADQGLRPAVPHRRDRGGDRRSAGAMRTRDIATS